MQNFRVFALHLHFCIAFFAFSQHINRENSNLQKISKFFKVIYCSDRFPFNLDWRKELKTVKLATNSSKIFSSECKIENAMRMRKCIGSTRCDWFDKSCECKNEFGLSALSNTIKSASLYLHYVDTNLASYSIRLSLKFEQTLRRKPLISPRHIELLKRLPIRLQRESKIYRGYMVALALINSNQVTSTTLWSSTSRVPTSAQSQQHLISPPCRFLRAQGRFLRKLVSSNCSIQIPSRPSRLQNFVSHCRATSGCNHCTIIHLCPLFKGWFVL